MKKINKYVLILILFIISSFKSVENKDSGLSPYYGMVNIANLFYVDQTEITVDSWISYYYWYLRMFGEQKAKEVLPDSLAVDKCVWKYIKSIEPLNLNSFSVKLATHTGQPVPKIIQKNWKELRDSYPFYSHFKQKKCPFGQFPITGLSYEQVLNFCNWRTKYVGHDTVKFCLPTKEEWKKIVLFNLDHSQELIDSIAYNKTKSKNILSFNYCASKSRKEYEYWGQQGQSIKNVAFFAPNKLNVYDLFGNVSEMTSQNGIAKGGNYTLYASQCKVDSVQYYFKPEKWLGFRCIAKINNR